MDSPNSGPSSAVTAVPKKRRGCFFYGCLTTAIAVLLSLVAMYYVASKSIRHVVESYGSSAPLDIPRATLTIGDYQDVIVRLRAFKQQLSSGVKHDPLVLTEKDFNAVLQHDSRFEGVPCAASLADGGLELRGSLPLEAFGYRGIYLNGVVRIRPVEGSTPPELKIAQVLVGDKQLPSEVMQQLGEEDIAKAFAEDPELRDIWPQLTKAEIKDQQLLLYPR